MITNSDITGSENHQPETFKVYKRRWWILFTFSCLSLLQCSVWNTFGPIYKPVQYAYDWSDGTVAMMANWGTITFVTIVFPLCFLLETKGLRVTTITVSMLVAIGASLRVMSVNEKVFTPFAHICAILNGFAGATIMSAPPALSAIWFPPEQRTTATCINQVFNNLGNGVSFLLGPYLVPDDNFNKTSTGNATIVAEVKTEIQIYMAIEAGVALTLLFAFIVYFPKQPPTPPSASASLEKTSFKEGLKALVTNKSVLLCVFGYSFSGGILGAWQGIMSINFRLVDVNDEQSGYIGLGISIASAIVGIGVSYVTDHIRKHMKTTLVILLVLEALCFAWLTLILAKVIPFNMWQLWASTVTGSSVTFTLAPLFFEYTAELAFPVPEGLVGGLLTCVNNFVGCIFLFIFMIPNVGTIWMNYVLVGSALVSIPAVIFTKESYRRLDIDVPSNSSNEDIQANHSYHVMEE